jgi:hypothetical protein
MLAQLPTTGPAASGGGGNARFPERVTFPLLLTQQEEYDLDQTIDTGKLIDAAGAGRSMMSPGWLTQLNQLWGGKSVGACPSLAGHPASVLLAHAAQPAVGGKWVGGGAASVYVGWCCFSLDKASLPERHGHGACIRGKSQHS